MLSADLSKSLLEGELHGKKQERSQFFIGFKYFALIYKLRFQVYQFFVLPVIAGLLFWLESNMSKMNVIYINPFRNSTNWDNSETIQPPSSYFNNSIYEKLFVAPDTAFSRFFTEQWIDPKNRTIHLFFNTENELSAEFNQNESTRNIGMVFSSNFFEKGNRNVVRIVSSFFSLKLRTISQYIYDGSLVFRNHNVSFDMKRSDIQLSKSSPDFKYGSTYSIVTNFAIILLLWRNVYQILEIHEQKLFLLLKISGIHELTLWITTFLSDYLIYLVFMIYQTYALFYFDFSSTANPSVVFLYSFLSISSEYFMMLAMAFIIKETKNFKYITIIFIVCALFIPLYQVFFDHKTNKSLIKLFIIAFPQFAQSFFIQNLALCGIMFDGLNWNLMKHSVFIDTDVLFKYLGFSILFYFIVFLISVLFSQRPYGSAPIGWRNIFNLSSWKRIFLSGSGLKNTKVTEQYPLLEVENICKTYYGTFATRALNNVSFSVTNGEVIILIGPNGCGKSTLLNSMSGTIDADSGNLIINGVRSSVGFAELQDMVGICFQDNVFFPTLSVFDHLLFFSEIRGQSFEEATYQIDHILSGMNMEQCRYTSASLLSGGQKRKLCISLAFMGNPSFVILDEPTAGVDVNARRTIWKAISQFKNTSSIISCHSLEEAESISSRIFVMRSGGLVFSGTPSELRRRFKCGYRVSAIGSNPNIESLLRFIRNMIPDSTHDPDRNDSVLIPVDDRFVPMLESIEPHIHEFGINSLNVSVEALEHVLLRIYSEEEGNTL